MKRRVLAFVSALTLSLNSVGISLIKNDKPVTLSSPLYIEEPAGYCRYLSSETIPLPYSRSTSGDDSPYFQKGEDDLKTIEDLRLTLEEKGLARLSLSARTAIDNISKTLVNDINYDYISALGADDLSIFLSPFLTDVVDKHSNEFLYDVENDDIYWEQLPELIYVNNLLFIGKDCQYKGIEKKDSPYESLSKEDIISVLNQLEDFVHYIKDTYPNYDMKHLACVLSQCTFLYDHFPSNAIAATGTSGIRWNVINGKYPNLSSFITTNEHEFKHLLCAECEDENGYSGQNNEYYWASFTGVEGFLDSRLSMTFIEEATAEELSAQMTNRDMDCYLINEEILNNIRLVLSMQDDYEPDGFLKYGLLQNPIALIQQLPLLNVQKYSFADNVRMLAAYEDMIGNGPYDFIFAINKLKGCEGFPFDKSAIDVYKSLLNYAQIQLSRMFYTNLIVLNETKDVPLDYNLFMLRLFEKRMDIAYRAINFYLKKIVPDIDLTDYENYASYHLDNFLSYLSNTFHMSISRLNELYREYSLDDDVTYPKFLSEDVVNLNEFLRWHDFSEDELNEKMEKSVSGLVYKNNY